MLTDLERLTAGKSVNLSDTEELLGLAGDRLDRFCKDFELDDVQARWTSLQESIKRGLDLSGKPLNIGNEAKVTRELLTAALENRYFLFLPPGKAKILFQDAFFSAEARKKYPEAMADMLAARMCYATDNNTAAVFHAVRIAEYRMRALARRLRVRTRRPLPFEDWGRVLGAIEDRLKELRGQPRQGRREEQLRFWAATARHLQYLNDLWRRNVAHARDSYSSREALEALEHVRDLFGLLERGGVRRKPPTSGAVTPIE